MIDVVIPVYRGLEQTRICLASVLASPNNAAFEVVVVDDCSPEPGIPEYLAQLAREGRIVLLRNQTNEGFVRSVNRAMALHEDRDVILLNSDTEVANDWIDRLVRCAYSAPRIATVTPFSNNATICSYPFDGWHDGLPGGLDLAELDRVFASVNADLAIEIPTAVGFCMFARRDSLHEIGYFDAERYGHGYGEENDFSMAAGKAGWKNLLACDVFVYHEGAVSFSSERAARVHAATTALLEVHPEYTTLVREFIIADPAADARRAVDRARVMLGTQEGALVLSERFQERAALLRRMNDAEKFAAERDAHVGELHRALARATELVAERTREMEKAIADVRLLDGEIGALRAGLSHAESLALERLAELEQIKSFWLWHLYRLLLGARKERGTHGAQRTER